MSLSNYVPKIKSSDDVLIDFEQANEMEDIKDEKPAFNKTSNFHKATIRRFWWVFN